MVPVLARSLTTARLLLTEKNTCYRDIHIITLPEMYLVAAEAYLKAGDNPKALARLNEVHQRAGLPALTGTITIDDILDEKCLRELR